MSELNRIRYLDDELEEGERAALEALLARDPSAAASVERLRRRSAGVAAALAQLDPPAAVAERSASAIRARMLEAQRAGVAARRRAWAPALLRAAAVAAVLLGGALVVPPARAWIVERVQAVAAALGLRAAPEAPAAPDPQIEAQPPAGSAVAVVFDVTVDTLDIETGDVAGELILRHGELLTARLEVFDAPEVEAIYGANRLTLRGRGSETARFDLVLPDRVAAVRVRSAGEPARVLALPGGEPVRVTLSPR